MPARVFATPGVHFFVGGLDPLTAFEDLAGVTGLALAALAVYGAWAAELEDAHRKPVLPLGRRGKGREAVELPLLEHVREVDSEAGVKKQL